MTLSYQDEVAADIRLRMLQLLASLPEYTCSLSALGTALCARFGHCLGADRLGAEATWLDELGLVMKRPVGSTWILVLSIRGQDVAKGRSEVPGVARPAPGE